MVTMKNYGLVLLAVLSIAIIGLAFMLSIFQEKAGDLATSNLIGDAKVTPSKTYCAYDLVLAQERLAKLEYENQLLKEELARR